MGLSTRPEACPSLEIVTLTVTAVPPTAVLTVIESGAGFTSIPTTFFVGAGAGGITCPTNDVDSSDFVLAVSSITTVNGGFQVANGGAYTTAIPTAALVGGGLTGTGVLLVTVKVKSIAMSGGEFQAPPALLITPSGVGVSATAATATALMGIENPVKP